MINPATTHQHKTELEFSLARRAVWTLDKFLAVLVVVTLFIACQAFGVSGTVAGIGEEAWAELSVMGEDARSGISERYEKANRAASDGAAAQIEGYIRGGAGNLGSPLRGP